ncbi:MAG: hypothetical protein IJV34_06120 [Prevotella sp.]|nr:hypothetical protein [Prevotella sp.]
MKKIQYLFLALVCGAMTSCMNKDWDDPQTPAESVYGNNSIQETNVMTIQALKAKFNTEFTTEGKYKEIKEDIQIKGVVTGNDIQGNMYNEISIQDETGAIFIGIAQGGVYGYLPLGTEILIDLRGLYVGNYRKSPTIGTPYTDKDGEVSVSRMARMLWQQHFKYTGQKKEVKPEVFAVGKNPTKWNIDTDAGKLGVLVGVTVKNGGYYNSDLKNYISNVPFTESSTYSHPDYSTSWYFNEQNDGQTGGVQIYTSCYADFAAKLLSHKKLQITGVFKRYRDQWEIIIRSEDDVVELPDDWEPTDDGAETIAPKGTGTADNPFNVAAALAKCEEVGETGTTENVYAEGYIVSISEVSPQIDGKGYGNATFMIADSKEGGNMLTVYRAKGLDNQAITDANIIKEGDKVVICGKLVNFKGNTPEFTQGCYIVSINAEGN